MFAANVGLWGGQPVGSRSGKIIIVQRERLTIESLAQIVPVTPHTPSRISARAAAEHKTLADLLLIYPRQGLEDSRVKKVAGK